jgi:hypothetical protein
MNLNNLNVAYPKSIFVDRRVSVIYLLIEGNERLFRSNRLENHYEKQ